MTENGDGTRTRDPVARLTAAAVEATERMLKAKGEMAVAEKDRNDAVMALRNLGLREPQIMRACAYSDGEPRDGLSESNVRLIVKLNKPR